MKKVAISQSNYIPWKGYFDGIAAVDEFVLYDDMQFTKRDWRNRNKIKTSKGLKWLTIPVDVKGKYLQKIKDTKVSDPQWTTHHLNMLKSHYKEAPCFKEILPFLEHMYAQARDLIFLTDVNYLFMTNIAQYLGISSQISRSSDYLVDMSLEKSERLVDLCIQLNATDYYSGSAATNYLDESLFAQHDINVHYFDYSGYPVYEQLHGDFEHGVTIVDLLFHKGMQSNNYLKHCNV